MFIDRKKKWKKKKLVRLKVKMSKMFCACVINILPSTIDSCHENKFSSLEKEWKQKVVKQSFAENNKQKFSFLMVK